MVREPSGLSDDPEGGWKRLWCSFRCCWMWSWSPPDVPMCHSYSCRKDPSCDLIRAIHSQDKHGLLFSLQTHFPDVRFFVSPLNHCYKHYQGAYSKVCSLCRHISNAVICSHTRPGPCPFEYGETQNLEMDWQNDISDWVFFFLFSSSNTKNTFSGTHVLNFSIKLWGSYVCTGDSMVVHKERVGWILNDFLCTTQDNLFFHTSCRAQCRHSVKM